MGKERKIVDELRIVTLLKAAPQTTVFHAEDPGTGRPVVLKLINALGGAAGQENRERFEAEIRRLGEAGLPFFPQVQDFGFTPDGRAFLVTSLEEGQLLAKIEGGTPEETLQLLSALAGCLAVLESLGIHHHNITPSNVLTIGDNILLLGLGSVGFLGPLMRHSPEWAHFAAPELAGADTGGEAPGSKADLYSTALVAAELLGATVEDAGGSRPVVRLPGGVRSEVADPVGLEEVLATCLRRAPAGRRISLAELAETLRTGGESAPIPDLADLGGVGSASSRIAPPPPPTLVENREAMDPNATRPAMTPEELASFSVEPEEGWGEAPEAPEAPEDAVPAPPAVPPPIPQETAPETPPTPPPQVSDFSRTVESASVPRGVAAVEGRAAAPAEEAPGPERAAAGSGVAPETNPAFTPPEGPPPTAKTPPAANLLHTLRSLDPRILLGAGVVVLLAVVAVIFLVFGRGGAEKPPPLAPAEAAPSAVVVEREAEAPEAPEVPEAPELDARIEEARAALEAGDPRRAGKILAELTAADVEQLDEASRAAYDELQQRLQVPARDRAVRNLNRALERGDVRLLRRTMRELDAMPRSELAGVRGLRGKMDRARKAIRLHTLLWRARKAGDHLQVIERAGALLKVLPAYSRARTLREEAAQEVERRAEAAAGRHDYAVALRLLEKERELWPEREGIDGRIQVYRIQAERNEKLEAALREAADALDAGDPARGLKILDSVKPSGSYVERFDQMRTRLQSALEARDAQPPRVVLEPGFKLRFKKHQTLVIPFEVTDDLGVTSVVAHLRRKGERIYRKVPLRHVSGTVWVLDLTPELHGNATVELFVVAEDASGHKGILGTGSRPLRVLRKRWYQK